VKWRTEQPLDSRPLWVDKVRRPLVASILPPPVRERTFGWPLICTSPIKENKNEHQIQCTVPRRFIDAVPSFDQTGVGGRHKQEDGIQFDVPVEIPGRVLAPGKYVFKIADTSDLNVVQVYSEDANGHDNLIDTIAATPEHIGKTPKAPIINFEDLPGHPKAIRSWFAAGNNWGWKFSYPTDKDQ